VSEVRSIFEQSDGKILLGSTSGADRVNQNGGLDTTFNSSSNSTVVSAVQQSDGKILIGGYFDSVNGISRNRIARLEENGALDTTFSVGVAGVSTFSGRNVRSIRIQSDGKILLGGLFTFVSGTPRNNIARLQDSPIEASLHTTSDTVESIDLFVASTSSSPAERKVLIYADGESIGEFAVGDNSGAKKIFSIPPTFGAGVEITANRTSTDYTPTIFGHVNVQEDDE
jgi:hypothetical protein